MESNAIRSRWFFLVVIVLAGVVAGGVLGSWAARNGYPLFTSGLLTPTLASNGTTAQPGPAPTMPDSFAPVIQPDLPGVVHIFTTKVVKPRYSFQSPFFNNPFFQQFFGNQFGPQGQPQPQKEYALGSGVIVRPDGIVLTNNHVVAGATDIRVTLRDGRDFKAKVLGTDPRTDLAVLRIDASGLTALQLGDSNQMRIGDIVFAIGDPFGVGETVTMGIVSAKGRATLSQIEGAQSIEDFIQTDAAINPGNSGGALINVKGQVIGINTAIMTGGQSEGNIGIGFAIPINLAKFVMNQIIAHGKVERGEMGVSLQAMSNAVAKAFGLPKKEGALIQSVTPGSPAAKAGIRRGDIILKLNGEPVKDRNDLVLKVTQLAPGTTVRTEIYRNGVTRTVPVTLEPSTITVNQQGGSSNSTPGKGTPMEGVQVQTLTPNIAGQLGLPSDTFGVVVRSVDPNSPAADASPVPLQRGVVIQEVNHHRVANTADFDQQVQAAGDKPILLYITTSQGGYYTVVRPSGD
jgi:Do/DeqQ family serine protease